MKSEHIRQVTEPSNGHPGYVIGVGALIVVVGVALVVIGAVRA